MILWDIQGNLNVLLYSMKMFNALTDDNIHNYYVNLPVITTDTKLLQHSPERHTLQKSPQHN